MTTDPAAASPTLTERRPLARATPATPRCSLCLALQGHDPCAQPRRWDLTDVDEVVIVRAALGDIPAAEHGVRRLVVPISDPWLSRTHARLVRSHDRWHVEDTRSKNHTFVNGIDVERAPLVDGDHLRLGRSFFVFRDEPPQGSARPALDGASLGQIDPALATLRPDLTRTFRQLIELAPSKVPLLISGETGVGKELIARVVHSLSRRREFVAVNCAAIPQTLVASELFGYRAGAFTGAIEDRPGLVRTADGGTLFLDEIGDLPLASQGALLRVLQDQEVTPVGSTKASRVDIRVVAATHQDLWQLALAGRFRTDLYARLSGFEARLPPLRDRREDLGFIVAALLRRLNGTKGVELESDAVEALFSHTWPLNIRELEQCLATARLLAVAEQRSIALLDLPERVRPSEPRSVSRPARPRTSADMQEREELEAKLREHDGNVSAMARALGEHRRAIQRRFKRLGIDPKAFKPPR